MDNRLFYLISKTENTMSVYIKQQFTKAGLKVTPGQLAILFLLKGKNRQTMTDISLGLGTDNSGMTRLIDRLEKNGLVERNNSTSDRREYHISITEEGITETERAKKVITAVNKKIENEFSLEELDDFRKKLIRIDSIFRV